MNSIELKSQQDLQDWLAQHKNSLLNKVVRLHGDIGAGKTTLVRLYLALLAADNKDVSSPTFAIHHQYQTSYGVIDHLDLYRLEDKAALEDAGFWDILTHSQTAFIEWPQRVAASLWPQRQYVDLYLENNSEKNSSGRFLRWVSL